ncbi:hypothetical protein SY88_07020 [Clostridiales bacterium PH28_bin88]|nr:hypothetical protein SY88_07020 [Clostridiales bacterium PH28_bin88]
MDLETYLSSRLALVNHALERLIPSGEAYPQVIHQAMRYSTFAGGKRLRPILTLAAAEAVGGDPERALPTACALEMIHTYSLIHDDLPAMDNDDFRRGIPTCHKAYGEAMAILAGDALLTRAFEVLSGNAELPGVSPEVALRVIREVAEAAGSLGLIAGQVVDIQSEGVPVSTETLRYIHEHKTGVLFKTAVRSGALISMASEKKLVALTDYAGYLGLAFQITDDILDVEGTIEKLGKSVGSDEKKLKATYPALFGLARSKELAGEAVAQAISSLEGLGAPAEPLREMARYLLARDH